MFTIIVTSSVDQIHMVDSQASTRNLETPVDKNGMNITVSCGKMWSG